MRFITERLVMLMTLLFVAVVAAQSGSTTAVAIALAIAAIACIKASAITGRRTMTVGARAHEHREVLSEMTAPQHPDTAGRPRTRAPSQVAPAL